jgi:hypothetical protein
MTASIGTKQEHSQGSLRHAARYDYYLPVSARNSKSAKSKKIPEWLVYRLGGAKAAYLGLVKAPNREIALALAYEEFEIPPAERRRIIVRATGHA